MNKQNGDQAKATEAANPPKKSKKGLVIGLLVVVVIVALGMLNLKSKNKEKVKEVNTVLVAADDLAQTVSANGEIGSRENAAVVSKISGSIKQLYIAVGDSVKTGDPIALIDAEQILVQQKSAIANLESVRRGIKEELLNLRNSYSQAKSTYEKAQRTYENVKQIHALGSASNEQLTEAEDALTTAKNNYQAVLQRLNFREGRALDATRENPAPDDDAIIEQSVEVKQAVANLNAINSNLTACDIRARLSGIITELNVEEGGVLSVGMVLARIHNPALLEVAANIDEVDLGNIKINQAVKIESDSFLDRTLSGEVSFIAPLIRKIGESRVCQIRVAFQDPAKEARVGASCSIFITVKDLKGVPVIPIEAYLQEEGKKYAFKISENEQQQPILAKVEIETGLIGIDNVEVVSGLSVGDEIVKEDLKILSEGLRVKPKRDKDDPVE